jgi:hypothetical protein
MSLTCMCAVDVLTCALTYWRVHQLAPQIYTCHGRRISLFAIAKLNVSTKFFTGYPLVYMFDSYLCMHACMHACFWMDYTKTTLTCQPFGWAFHILSGKIFGHPKGGLKNRRGRERDGARARGESEPERVWAHKISTFGKWEGKTTCENPCIWSVISWTSLLVICTK